MWAHLQLFGLPICQYLAHCSVSSRPRCPLQRLERWRRSRTKRVGRRSRARQFGSERRLLPSTNAGPPPSSRTADALPADLESRRGGPGGWRGVEDSRGQGVSSVEVGFRDEVSGMVCTVSQPVVSFVVRVEAHLLLEARQDAGGAAVEIRFRLVS